MLCTIQAFSVGWVPSGTQVYVTRKILWICVENENVWEGQKQVHRRRQGLGWVSEPALSVQSSTADSTLPATLILLSPEVGQEGKMGSMPEFHQEPKAGSHPGERLPINHMFNAYCIVPSV